MNARLWARLAVGCVLALALSVSGASAAQGAAHGSLRRARSLASVPPALPAPAGAPSDVGGELPALRTATSRTYLSKQGGFVQMISAVPLNYKDAQGVWRPVDNRLVVSGSGYANAGNGYALSLPASLSSPVRIALDGASVSMQLQDATGSVAASTATATYAQALPGVSVAYTAESASVKEALVLAGPSAQTRFSYALTLSQGLQAEAAASGAVVVRDASGAELFALAAPFMRDAAGASTQAVTISLSGSAPTYSLTVTADPGWLSAPGRSWPVTVDPSWFVVEHDTFIQSGFPTTSSGFSPLIDVGLDGTGNTARGLVSFDLSSLPAGMQIEHAQLELYQSATAGCNCNESIDVDQLTRPFTANATWNTSDGTTAWSSAGGDYASAPASSQIVPPTVGWYLWQISGLVRQWYEGAAANDGLLLKASDESGNTNLAEFNSSDSNTNPPALFVTYQPRVGLRSLYGYRDFAVGDRVSASVNLGNGNLLVANHDATITGVNGFDLNLTHYYNSINANLDGQGDANVTAETGAQWSFMPECFHNWPDPSLVYQDASGYELTFDSLPGGGWAQADGSDATVSSDPNDSGADWLTSDQSGSKLHCYANGLGSSSDRNGNKLIYYLNGSELAHIDDAVRSQQDVTFSYNNDLLQQMQDYSGRAWSYAYNTNGDLTSATDATNKTVNYGYNSSHQMTSITDPDGNQTTISYDSQGRVSEIQQGLTSLGICAPTTTCPTTTFSYPASLDSNCSGVANATGETIVTDPRSHNWSYCYDNRLRIIKTVDPDGHHTTTDYTNANGGANCADDNACSTTDALGKTTVMGYNTGGSGVQQGENLLYTQSPLEGTSNRPSFAYNSGAHPFDPSQYTDPEYAGAGTGKHSWLYSYDTNGNLASKSEGDTGSGQNPVSFTYNGDGTLATATDSKGNVTTYCYDTAQDCSGATTHNLTAVIPPSPLGKVTLSYDSLNRIHTVTDGQGNTRTYSYDALDRVTQIAYNAGPTLSYSYDADGNLTGSSDPTGSYTNHYDTLNRLTEEDQPGAVTISYGYDPASNLTSLTDASGTTDYTYNNENLVASLLEPGASTPIQFAYDANGNRTQIVYPTSPDKVTEVLQYDDAQRLSRVYAEKPLGSGNILTSFSYCYKTSPAGCSGNDTDVRTAMTAQYPGGAAVTTYYCYDGLSRLVSADTSSASCPNTSAAYQYAYDTTGNITSKTINGTTTNYTVNNANELTNSGDSYDLNGSQTADPGTYSNTTYNTLDQATSITPTGGSPFNLAYSGLNQANRVTNGTINQINDQLGLNEDSGSPNTFYTRDPGGAMLGERRSGSYYFLHDGLGSIAAVTDSTGTVVTSYHYDPYGNTICTPGSSSCNFYEPIRYAGGYWDQNTQSHEALYKFGQRYYDPTLGRWTQPDPLNNPLDLHGWNGYTYASDDPINAIDPAGTKDCAGCSAVSELWEYLFGDVNVVLDNPSNFLEGTTLSEAREAGLFTRLRAAGYRGKVIDKGFGFKWTNLKTGDQILWEREGPHDEFGGPYWRVSRYGRVTRWRASP